MPEDEQNEAAAPPEQQCKKRSRVLTFPLFFEPNQTRVDDAAPPKKNRVKIPGKPSVSRRPQSQAVKLSATGRTESDALRVDTLIALDLHWQAVDDGSFTMDDYYDAEEHLAVLLKKLRDGPNQYMSESFACGHL